MAYRRVGKRARARSRIGTTRTISIRRRGPRPEGQHPVQVVWVVALAAAVEAALVVRPLVAASVVTRVTTHPSISLKHRCLEASQRSTNGRRR